MDIKPLSELTNEELIAYIKIWQQDRKKEFELMGEKSLTDLNVLAPLAKGFIQDITKLFDLIEDLLKRLP